ncbi:MAG: PAC2 family protein, partial [Acidimicrobiia bacterium]
IEFSDGAVTEIRWPSLSISASTEGRAHLLVLTGAEPDTRWQEAAAEIAQLAEAAGVRRVVSVGAVAAAVAHTRATPIMTTSTDPEVESFGLPVGRFSVPGAFVNVVSHHIAHSKGVPEVGFWAQIPHYVSGVYWPGVEAIMSRLVSFLGVEVNVAEIVLNAHQVRQRLDRALAGRPDARDFVRRLEETTPGFGLEGNPDLAEEIEEFLRDLGDDDNPFS